MITSTPQGPSVTVSWSVPTGIPGYEPSWTLYKGDDWVRAYDFARAHAPVIANMHRVGEYRTEPSLPAFYTALRDGAGATLQVWSHQSAITLGRPFEPKLLGTIRVQVGS